MLAHKFVEQTLESESHLKKQKTKQSWWSFGWWTASLREWLFSPLFHLSVIYLLFCGASEFIWFAIYFIISRNNQSFKDESEPFKFSEEDWEQLNKIIGYKEGDDEQSLIINEKLDVIHTALEIHVRHNASKLVDGSLECLAELSCEGLDCSIKLYPETKVFDVKLGSYRLSSPNGLLAEVWFLVWFTSSKSHCNVQLQYSFWYLKFLSESVQSAVAFESLVGVFCYKPFDVKVDWSMVAKASPCYMTVCFFCHALGLVLFWALSLHFLCLLITSLISIWRTPLTKSLNFLKAIRQSVRP